VKAVVIAHGEVHAVGVGASVAFDRQLAGVLFAGAVGVSAVAREEAKPKHRSPCPRRAASKPPQIGHGVVRVNRCATVMVTLHRVRRRGQRCAEGAGAALPGGLRPDLLGWRVRELSVALGVTGQAEVAARSLTVMYRSFLWLMRSPGLPPTRYAHRESRILPTRVLQKWLPKWLPKHRAAVSATKKLANSRMTSVARRGFEPLTSSLKGQRE